MKKKNTGLVIVLVILLLGLVGYICYDKFVVSNEDDSALKEMTSKYENAQNKIKEMESKLTSSTSKNYIVNNEEGTKEDIHVYAIGYQGMAYTYNGEFYFAYGYNDYESIFDGDVTKGTKLNIKESDINRVFIAKNYTASEPAVNVYFIYKNGSVERMNKGKVEVLKDYKVDDLRVKCNKRGDIGNCEVYSYDLTLQDGTTKTVEEK